MADRMTVLASVVHGLGRRHPESSRGAQAGVVIADRVFATVNPLGAQTPNQNAG